MSVIQILHLVHKIVLTSQGLISVYAEEDLYRKIFRAINVKVCSTFTFSQGDTQYDQPTTNYPVLLHFFTEVCLTQVFDSV